METRIFNTYPVMTKNSEQELQLFYSAIIGDIHTIQSLIKSGINIEARDELGENALFKAALHCQSKTVSYLLQEGANPMARNNEGDTVLRKTLRLGSRISNNNFQNEQYRIIAGILRLNGALR